MPQALHFYTKWGASAATQVFLPTGVHCVAWQAHERVWPGVAEEALFLSSREGSSARGAVLQRWVQPLAFTFTLQGKLCHVFSHRQFPEARAKTTRFALSEVDAKRSVSAVKGAGERAHHAYAKLLLNNFHLLFSFFSQFASESLSSDEHKSHQLKTSVII